MARLRNKYKLVNISWLVSLSLPHPWRGGVTDFMHQPRRPGGIPGVMQRSPGHPRSETHSSNLRQPSKHGNSASNPICATRRPGCWSRWDLGNVLEPVLAPEAKSAGRGAALPRSHRHLPSPRAGTAPTGNAGPAPCQVESGRVATTMQRISYQIKPSQAQGEASSLHYQSQGESP